MRYLFFFGHPAKFHVFRRTINALKSKGHQVEILITAKDVLEDLVKAEGWEYTNIFPEGRKIRSLPVYLGSAINAVRTLWRLARYTKGRKYDLFVSSDLLVWIGKFKGIPSLVFTDDDLYVAKQFSLVLAPASWVLAPEITDLGKFNSKKIGFPSYKELAYLHPNVFQPDRSLLNFLEFPEQPFFILRLVSLQSYHDLGKSGLSNPLVERLIPMLEKRGRVFISTERPLPPDLEKYRLKINPIQICHAIAFAEMFIGDSQTMTSEAAVLGTPSIRCNDFVGKISVMEEKVEKYQLSLNYTPKDDDRMISDISELLKEVNIKAVFQERKNRMLMDKIDLSAFLTWFLENYPQINPAVPIDFEKFKLE